MCMYMRKSICLMILLTLVANATFVSGIALAIVQCYAHIKPRTGTFVAIPPTAYNTSMYAQETAV